MPAEKNIECLKTLMVDGKVYHYFSLDEASKALGVNFGALPYSMKVVLEGQLRALHNGSAKLEDLKAFAEWLKTGKSTAEINLFPGRVLLQDFTGVPAVVDLAAMRDAVKKLGGDASKINPLKNVDLVIDHSVHVNNFGKSDALARNIEVEMRLNKERYTFLRWGQNAFNNFKVVPPGTGICHQVNLEYLAKVVWTEERDGKLYAYPDTLVGTDSHTTMVNGLSVLGWGVGGIEAEAVMLGGGLSMLMPEVIGFKLTGSLKEGTTATDLVLTVTQMLRQKGVVNKFVEFFGAGLSNLSLADRATISNMAPEYGATCGFFPIDHETIAYLKLSSREEHLINLVEAYAKAQDLWFDPSKKTVFTDVLELDLSTVEPSLAGPKRPQDKILLSNAKENFTNELKTYTTKHQGTDRYASVVGKDYKLSHGDIVIAAITSCTNTSNPAVMIAAGLVAKKAAALGLTCKPWVKTSLAPGSKVVSEYLAKSGLQKHLDELGFNIVGYGCTTCIGNSGPLQKEIEDSISQNEVVAAAVLSGNRNFEGRVHPLTRANYLASPPLVVAYAIAGSILVDLYKDPIGKDASGKELYLSDLWPTNKEIADVMHASINAEMFKTKYADVFSGDDTWKALPAENSLLYSWDQASTYIANPPYFETMSRNAGEVSNIQNARLLALFGDSITTDHISPAGNISKTSPAAKYLMDKGVAVEDFNSYGARRGHHEVMMRGTFANIRIKNELMNGAEGGNTIYFEDGSVMSIYDAAMQYIKKKTPLIIIAGKEYGTGSSRDWAAKGTYLLGVKAVIAESFERIHRSNLVRMGVLPLCFKDGMTRKDLGLRGDESFSINGFAEGLKPLMDAKLIIERDTGVPKEITLKVRIDTEEEVTYMKHGGIMQYVIRQMI